MRTLHLFTDEGMFEIEVTEVEASDICPATDKLIDKVEAYGGWWVVYQIPTGEFVAYFEEEE